MRKLNYLLFKKINKIYKQTYEKVLNLKAIKIKLVIEHACIVFLNKIIFIKTNQLTIC